MNFGFFFRAITKALEDSGQTFDSIDAVAVTKGPGLEICLRVGCRKAQVQIPLSSRNMLYYTVF